MAGSAHRRHWDSVTGVGTVYQVPAGVADRYDDVDQGLTGPLAGFNTLSIVLSATEPAGLSDYEWEAWIFTGDGNSRRGLVVRADPTNGFASNYQLVIQSGLLQMNFRKLLNSTPTTLGTWFTNTLPGGSPTVNTWHRMKVIAQGNQFRCFFDGTELTATPIVDSDLTTGWVGVYNFRFDIGSIPFYTDDLLLSPLGATPTVSRSWGEMKVKYR